MHKEGGEGFGPPPSAPTNRSTALSYFDIEIRVRNILQALLSFISDLPQGGRARTSV